MYQIENDYMDLAQIADSGQCFRWKKIEENTYEIPRLDQTVTVTQEKNKFMFSCDEQEFNEIWRSYFDLDTDYGDIISRIDKNDTFLYDSALYGKGIRILRQDFWEMVVSFVISQNNNIPRITKSIQALCDKYGCFPTPELLIETDVDDFRKMGLGYRAEYMGNVAKYFLELKENPTKHFSNMDYDSAMKELMSIKGIGKKVANCVCLFGLYYVNACPIDTWMKKIIEEEYEKNIPVWMQGEYAGIYQQYTFYRKRMQK